MSWPLCRRALRLGVCLWYAAAIGCGAARPAVGLPRDAVELNSAAQDILACISLIQRNYSGYQDKIERYEAAILEAEDNARRVAAGNPGDDDADEAIRAYLDEFRDRHVSLRRLDLNPVTAPGASAASNSTRADARPPNYRVLGDGTPLIRIQSFELRYKIPLEAVLDEHDLALRAAAYIVIDIRGNTGGSDATYGCLSPILYTDPIQHNAGFVRATLENAKAWEDLLPSLPKDDRKTRAVVQSAVDKIRANPGGFVTYHEAQEIIIEDAWESGPPILVVQDGRTASSGEQFVLEALQSKKVTLLGENSNGTLDYANALPFALPSGKRRLSLATTRSGRLPGRGIDNVGIPPEVPIAKSTLNDDAALERFLVAFLRQPTPESN